MGGHILANAIMQFVKRRKIKYAVFYPVFYVALCAPGLFSFRYRHFIAHVEVAIFLSGIPFLTYL